MKGAVIAIFRSNASRRASCLFLVVFVVFIITKVTYLVILGNKKSSPKKNISSALNSTRYLPVNTPHVAAF